MFLPPTVDTDLLVNTQLRRKQMRGIATLLLCGLGIWAAASVKAAPGSNAVAVEPNLISPGQTITLRWYFTGTKVVVAGGRFGKGMVVTGKTSVTDHPRKTTRYTFDVWYRTNVVSPTTGKKTLATLHQQYTAVAEVSVALPGLHSYKDPHGWQVSYLIGWKRDHVTTPDEGSDGLVFFQKEDDSVERLAIAIMPVKDMTSEELIHKIRNDVPSHYDSPQFLQQVDLSYQEVPAQFMTFTGMDLTHPGTKTASVVLAFVRAGKAYVISARTDAAHFKARQALLENMVKSFRILKGGTVENIKPPVKKTGADTLALAVQG
jgi:hypothetical protein